MILYGSQTSPFVRRIRLLLNENDYEFVKVNIFDLNERQQLLKLSPLLKIPILKVNDEIIWDSRIIFNFFCQKGIHPFLKSEEENILTAINDVSDSLVQTLLAKRSELQFPKNTPIEISHRERIQNTFTYLESRVKTSPFETWNFISMCLFSLVDWVEFRSLANLNSYPLLLEFKEKNTNQLRINLTDPRCES